MEDNVSCENTWNSFSNSSLTHSLHGAWIFACGNPPPPGNHLLPFTFLRCHWFHILIIPSRRCDPSIQWRRIKIEVTINHVIIMTNRKKLQQHQFKHSLSTGSNLCLPNKAELVQIQSYFHFRLHVAHCSLSFALLCFCFYTLHICFACNSILVKLSFKAIIINIIITLINSKFYITLWNPTVQFMCQKLTLHVCILDCNTIWSYIQLLWIC